MKTHVSNVTRPKSDQVREIERPTAAGEALLLLATHSQDPCALVAVYDEYGDELKAAAVRWFGKDPEVRNKAVNSILGAISRQVWTYDPLSMDAAEWVRHCAEAEARRLREALDTAGGKNLRTRRVK